MNKFTNWLKTHKFLVHTVAFLIMIISPVPMFFAAQQSSDILIVTLLFFFLFGNILVFATS